MSLSTCCKNKSHAPKPLTHLKETHSPSTTQPSRHVDHHDHAAIWADAGKIRKCMFKNIVSREQYNLA